MKQFFLLVLVAVFLDFSPGHRYFSGKPRSTDSLLAKLKTARENADEYYLTHGDDLIPLVKVSRVDTLREIKDTLLQSKNNKWPDKFEYSYDILKDSTGKIIYVDRISSGENPYSLHIYIHYFDERGNTYAFMKKEAMFFDHVKPKLVFDFHLWYYNKDFKVIGESDTVKDSNHQQVELTNDERNQMDFKHDIYRNLSSCLIGYNIKLIN